MKIRHIFLFILILLIGISLRICNLNKYDFSCAEAEAILIAKNIATWNIIDYGYLIDPPLFCWLLSFWLHLGNSEFILRLLPFIFGVLSIPAIYFVGKELFDKKVGLISAFILAISPLHIYYSQDLRTYSLLIFLVLIAIYFLVKSLKENKILYWVGFIIFTALTIYAHHVALFLIIAINCYFILSYKRYKFLLRNWLISQFFILLLYLPGFKIIFEQIYHIQAINLFREAPEGYLFIFIQIFLIFNLGLNAHKITHFFAILLFSPLFLLGIRGNEKKEIYLLLFWLFIPIAISIIVSKLLIFIFLSRTLIYVSPAYYILLSYGLSKIKLNKAFFCFLLFFGILSASSLKNYYQNFFYSYNYSYDYSYYTSNNIYFKFDKEIKLASDYINQNYQKGDVVLHTSGAMYPPFLYYHDNRLDERLIVFNNQIKSYLESVKKIKVIPVSLEEIEANSYKKFWVVLSSWNNDQRDNFPKDLKEYLDRNYIIIDCKKYTSITIYLYQIK